MNKKANRSMSRVALLTILSLLAGLALASFIVAANDEEKKAESKPVALEDNPAWKGRFYVGVGFADDKGTTSVSGLSAGRAAEYDPAETTGLFGVEGFYDKASTYAQISAYLLNGDDLGANINASLGRNLIADIKLDRFIHRLDNDLAPDWDPPFSVDPQSADQEMQLRATLLEGKVRFKASSIPSAVLFIHAKLVAREGDRQARTFDHCFTCHVTTQGQELDQTMFQIGGGAEYGKKPFAARYEYRYSDFSDSSANLTYTWDNRFGNFELEGTLPFAQVPDNNSSSHIGEARADLGEFASVSGRLRSTTTENDSTGYSLETTHASGRLTAYPVDFIVIRGRFDYWDTTNDTPLSAQRETTSFTGSATVRLHKSFNVEGRYRYYKRDRSGGTEVDESKTESFRIKGIWRPNNKWRVVASHEFLDHTNPFGRILRDSFSRIDDVLLTPYGTDEDRSYINVIYCPNMNSNFDIVYSRSHQENNEQNAEATFQNISANATFMLKEGVTIYGNYSYYKNEYNRDVYFGVLAPYLDTAPMPYEGEGTTLSVGASYMVDRFTLQPSWSYTLAKSSFDDSAIGTGISERSAIDATINRVGLVGGFPLMDKLDASLGYWLDDYSDDLQPQDDGRVQWVYAWLTWMF